MAAKNFKVQYSILGNFNPEGFARAEKALGNFEARALSASKKIQDMGRSLRDVGNSLSIYVTAPIIALGALAVKNFSEQEQALAKLEQSLKTAGTFTKQASQAMQDYASELQKTTKFGDETTLSALAMARNFSSSNEQTIKLTKAAAEMATVMGTDLESAVKQLGITLSGQAGLLSRQIPEIRNYTEEQLKAGAGLDLVIAKWGGSAAAAADTFGGRLQMLRNRWGDWLEVVGADIVPLLDLLVTKLNIVVGYLERMDDSTRRMILVFAGVAATIGPVLIGFGFLVQSVGFALAGITKLTTFIGSTFLKTLSLAYKAIVGLITILSGPVGIVLAIAAVVSVVAGLINTFVKLKQAGNTTGQALLKIFKLVGAAVINVLTQPFLKFAEGLQWVITKVYSLLGFEDLAAQAQKGKDKIAEWSNIIGGTFRNSVDDINKDLNSIGTDLTTTMTFGLNNTLSEGWTALKDKFSSLFTLPVLEDLDKVDKKSNEIKGRIPKKASQGIITFDSVASTITNNFDNAFQSIVSGTEDAGKAFKKFAASVVSDLARVIQQQLISYAIQQALGALFTTSAPTTTGGTTRPGGNITGVRTNASGGFISGPGTGTSDSIISRLSAGEYVNTAKTVNTFGVEFFDMLRGIAHGRALKPGTASLGFANGGSVSAPSTRFEIINNTGSNAQISDVQNYQDGKEIVTRIILEDHNSNGKISKSLISNFNMRRKAK